MAHEHPQPARPGGRTEPREIVELKLVRADHPEIASAVDMQIALIDLQRRVQSRVPLPWIEVDREWLKRQHGLGRPLLRFKDIPLDWTDLRLMLRKTADILRRFDAIEATDYAAVETISRAGHMLEPLVVAWYEKLACRGELDPDDCQGPRLEVPENQEPVPALDPDALDQLLLLAMKPFLERCSEVVLQRTDFSTWAHPYCPLCGGEPEFAVITPAADRLLICSRCSAQWRFHPLACPYCGNDDRSQITSFASRDGRYRIYACDVCTRYLKAYDGRKATRPVMVSVDSVATLPLDAAAMQRGYRG
ncbi:MAG: formate dehydrogenase accessory protein FdhE [Bacteroidales bacterium]